MISRLTLVLVVAGQFLAPLFGGVALLHADEVDRSLEREIVERMDAIDNLIEQERLLRIAMAKRLPGLDAKIEQAKERLARVEKWIEPQATAESFGQSLLQIGAGVLGFGGPGVAGGLIGAYTERRRTIGRIAEGIGTSVASVNRIVQEVPHRRRSPQQQPQVIREVIREPRSSPSRHDGIPEAARVDESDLGFNNRAANRTQTDVDIRRVAEEVRRFN